MQLWPKPDSQCALPDFPLTVNGAVGFWTAQGPMVCGGRGGENKCFLYREHQWMPSTNMGTARYWASALQIDSNQALIIGGLDENWHDLKTTEVISSSGSEEQNRFPVRIAGHCSFTINATHALVTGGWQNGSISANTWLVDLTTTTFTPGPIMKTARSFHGCSVFQRGTKSYGIVTGGMDIGRRYLDSTEMIKLDQESPTWTEGIQDKCKICILPLSKVFFLSIFRSKITQRKTNKQTQRIGLFDLGRNQSRHLCHGWMV